MAWEFHVGTESYIKYQIVISIGVPRIISLDGPYKGPAQDGSIMVETLAPRMGENETALADKQYRFVEHAITPLSGHRYELTEAENSFNADVYSIRQSVERVNSRLENFSLLKFHSWPYSVQFHALCMQAIGKLVNLSFIIKPL